MDKQVDITIGQLVDHLFTAIDLLKNILKSEHVNEDSKVIGNLLIQKFDNTFNTTANT